jgi:hypothetical protein
VAQASCIDHGSCIVWFKILFVYSYGLERRFRRELFLDFEDLALAQYNSGDLYGVEKYAAFWHFGGSKVVPFEVTTNTKVCSMSALTNTRSRFPKSTNPNRRILGSLFT